MSPRAWARTKFRKYLLKKSFQLFIFYPKNTHLRFRLGSYSSSFWAQGGLVLRLNGAWGGFVLGLIGGRSPAICGLRFVRTCVHWGSKCARTQAQ